MNHLPHMIYDLAIILAAAGISILLFKKLRQPIVLGYLIAGFGVGPHFPLWPTVIDTEGVKLWAEIGVIFLLFGLGLEFSFKKLAQVGKSAAIAATFELITMSGLGYVSGRLFGWSPTDSIFLGTILAMSSTTIIIRAFDEIGLRGKGFVNLVFGILIVEDLIGILLLVLLAAISTPGSFSGSNLLYLSARLGFFLLIWFVVGIYILPSFLKKIQKFLTDEIMLVVSIGLCLLMVVLATKAGFSAAIGAFIMGAILAETHEGERIEKILVSVKNLFAAVFFVSVGMLIDPVILREHFGVVVFITVITILGKLLGSGLGAVLSGRSLKQSVQAGMSLAQIGEFSFIIAMLGMTLGVTSDFLYPIVIAVSAVTTFTTPYLIKYSDTVYSWIEARLPQSFLDGLRKYELAMTVDNKEGPLGLIWRVYGLAALLNSVVVVAIALVCGRYLQPFLTGILGDVMTVRIFACTLTVLACSPFLLAIALKAPRRFSVEGTVTQAQLRSLQLGVLFMRIVLGLGLLVFIVNQFSSTLFVSVFVLLTASILMYLFRKSIRPFYTAFESQFLGNLNAKELAEMDKLARRQELAPWDATITEFVLSADSVMAGQTLQEIKLRTRTGATVVMIDRGRRRLFAPNRAERLLPGDQIFLLGTDEQLSAARILIETERPDAVPASEELYSLESAYIDEDSPYAKRSIREIGIGEEFGGLIVGIERSGKRLLNPESSVVLEPGDLIWVFGRRDRIQELKR